MMSQVSGCLLLVERREEVILGSKRRYPAHERRRLILEAALPLFARGGFERTTTREIARAAEVSDALLYKYFPSKRALYDALCEYTTTEGLDAAAQLLEREPSLESMIREVYFLLYSVLVGSPEARPYKDSLDHLLAQSMASDGDFLGSFHEQILGPWMEIVGVRWCVLHERGELLLERPPSVRDVFWFVHHAAFAMRMLELAPYQASIYEGSREERFAQMFLFALRGLGVPEEAISRYAKPVRLRADIDALFAQKESK